MNANLTLSSDTTPKGADILRERMRWEAAERRWQPPIPVIGPETTPRTPSRSALGHGAQLSLFLDTMAFAAARSW